MKELLKKVAFAGIGTMLLGGAAFASVGNDHTGYDSHNDASVESENELELDVDNDADIWNRVFGSLGTGYNEASKNTGNGGVDTGDADATVKVTNKANGVIVDAENCCMPFNGSLSVMNSTTGADSDNNAWVELENKTEVDVDNDADVHNCIDIYAKTGGNESSKNTGDGMVETGNSSASITVENNLNASEVTIQ